ncbi:hypothetical protein T492DRAFT_1116107 [Pavlovales sp. CCMP2436]|nr:hypothetical protein T492DRAFT_1116107 [Pavlovales sp. CCMP2436]
MNGYRGLQEKQHTHTQETKPKLFIRAGKINDKKDILKMKKGGVPVHLRRCRPVEPAQRTPAAGVKSTGRAAAFVALALGPIEAAVTATSGAPINPCPLPNASTSPINPCPLPTASGAYRQRAGVLELAAPVSSGPV